MAAKLAVRTGGSAHPRATAVAGPRRRAPGSNAALQRTLAPAAPLPPGIMQRLADLAGNQAVARLLHPPVALQRLLSISDVVPPGQRATPKEALTRYLTYLKGEASTYPDQAWMIGELDALRDEINAAGVLTAAVITEFRRQIDGYAGRLRAAEAQAKPVVVDSDITEAYKPLKACVLQSLEQFGVLGTTASAYHAELWRTNDPLKYYDMDTKIGPMYQRFGLTETDAGGQTYAQLAASLKVGRYVVNVTSPAGPNGHMFCLVVEPPTQKGKPNKAYSKQDPQNTQSWQPSDKILRYWVKS